MTGLEIEFDVPSGFETFQAPSNIPTLFNGDKIVIYGILKSKASSDTPLQSGIQGKATLKGQISGRTTTHSISFDIPAPPLMGEDQLESCTGFNLPVVHHLAAKSLLSDWKAGKGWGSTALTHEREQESTNLSIESSVICEHTAFVAIDEEQNKPIEGAIAVCDITATMVEENYLFEGMKGAPQQGLLSFGACGGAPPLLPSLNVQMKSEAAPSPAFFSVDSYVNSDNSFCSDEENASSDDEEMLRPMCASIMEPEISKMMPSESLTTLISLQHATGFWLLKDIAEKIVKKYEAELQPPPNVSGEIWATVVALVFLECNYLEHKDEWELVALKAEMWLSSQTLPCSIASLKEKAKNII